MLIFVNDIYADNGDLYIDGQSGVLNLKEEGNSVGWIKDLDIVGDDIEATRSGIEGTLTVNTTVTGDTTYLKLDCSNDPLTGAELDLGSGNLTTTGIGTFDGGVRIGANDATLTMGASDASDYYQKFDGTDPHFYTSGDFNFYAGHSDFIFNGPPGDLRLKGADGVDAIGEYIGRSLTLTGGNAFAGSDDDGGNLYLYAGSGDGTGSDGQIYLGHTGTSALGDLWLKDDTALYFGYSAAKSAKLYHDASHLVMDGANTGTGGGFKIPMSETQANAFIIDGDTNPFVADGVAFSALNVSRTVARVVSGAAVSQDSIIDFNITDNSDYTVTSGKANALTTYVFDQRVDGSNVLSGNTNVSKVYYLLHVNLAADTLIDNSADVTYSFRGVYSYHFPTVTLDNAALDFTYSGEAVYAHMLYDVRNTNSNSISSSIYAVRGLADKQGASDVAADVAYGGHFCAEDNTLNYGVYAEGATAALYLKGHTIFDADGTYTVGNATKKALAVYADDYYSADGSQGITQTETGVTDFDITIKDGLITAFTKNN